MDSRFKKNFFILFFMSAIISSVIFFHRKETAFVHAFHCSRHIMFLSHSTHIMDRQLCAVYHVNPYHICSVPVEELSIHRLHPQQPAGFPVWEDKVASLGTSCPHSSPHSFLSHIISQLHKGVHISFSCCSFTFRLSSFLFYVRLN